jgi:hypothetical protein
MLVNVENAENFPVKKLVLEEYIKLLIKILFLNVLLWRIVRIAA